MEEVNSLFSKLSANAPFIIEISLNITAALFILIIGWVFAKIVRKRLRNPGFGPKNFDQTLRPVVASGVFYVIMGMSIYAFLTKLGVPATSLLAVFGAMGFSCWFSPQRHTVKYSFRCNAFISSAPPSRRFC